MLRPNGRLSVSVLVLLAMVMSTCGALVEAQAKFREYVNGTRFRNVLVLGMYTAPEDTAAFLKNGTVNPFNGERFDAVIALGKGGEGFVVHAWEGGRVITDNLS